MNQFVTWIILAIMWSPLTISAAGLTADQLRMVEQLSPQDKAALTKQYGLSAQNKGAQPVMETPNPKVVRVDYKQNSESKPSGIESFVWKRLGIIQAQDSQAQDSQAQDSQAQGSQAQDPNEPWRTWFTGGEVQGQRKPLFQFGYQLFEGSPTTFAPVTEIPVPSEYSIGPGDELRIRYFGKRQDSLQLVVDRTGMIVLPDVGELRLAGLSFSEAKALISEEVRRKIIGVTVSVSMGELRSIRVFVLGDANHPGSYLVSSLSTISNALFVSGGISKQGSMRNITLKRKGRVIAKLDLYDFLLKGNTKSDVVLLPGDVVFVEPLGKTVAVYGEVNRPAIYEVKHENTVAKVLAMAGGLTSHADPILKQIDRINKQGDSVLIDIGQNDKRVAVQAGDIVIIHKAPIVAENEIELMGQVKRPGKYGFVLGMTLKDILPSKDSLLEDAYLEKVLVQEKDKHSGAISVERVDLSALFSNESLDWPALSAGDRVYVFKRSLLAPIKLVEASGEFVKPGIYPLGDGMTLTNLIFAAGGVTEKALLGNVEITRFEIVDGDSRESKHFNVDLSKALAGDASANILLQPHDVVTVRQLSNWRASEHVTLAGEVKFPGDYPIEDGERLADLIVRSGGFTDKAYLKAAVFTRESIREEQQKQIDEMISRMETEIAQEEEAIASLHDAQLVKHKQSALLAAKRVLGQMKATKAMGRLVIKLEDIKDLENSEFNLTLRDGDKLDVPKQPDQVMVLGQVYNTTALLYRKKYDLDDYVDAAGGMTRLADDGRVYVVRANGFVERAGGWGSTRIYPGDVIVVPEQLDQFSLLDSTLDWSRVLMQVGVGLASMKTIGVF
jgi:protein involved in polysaccharide export with SLBB domain